MCWSGGASTALAVVDIATLPLTQPLKKNRQCYG